MKGRDLLSIADLSPEEIWGLVERALAIKRGQERPSIAGATVALMFEKPSLRTRVSFHVAIHHLGGYSLELTREQVGLGGREPVEDMAKVLSRYVDALVVRTFAQRTLEELAQHATVPVINALSDQEHPCQALADLLTIYERRGALKGVTLAYVGDGNNVAASLALAASSTGMAFHIASPEGYDLPTKVLVTAQKRAAASGASVTCLRSPREAVVGADVLYTDVWASMGQEGEASLRRTAFMGYQVNEDLLALAAPHAILLHPMPAHYGEEVPKGFLNHPQSVAFDQAENRLHIQKAILAAILQL
ncbi:MAG: ornithine carbamoyltransferase [Dehalococcoidia bacterium]|nr:ornithine carbamoyltransferase [Dehalococcoidia bacterium]